MSIVKQGIAKFNGADIDRGDIPLARMNANIPAIDANGKLILTGADQIGTKTANISNLWSEVFAEKIDNCFYIKSDFRMDATGIGMKIHSGTNIRVAQKITLQHEAISHIAFRCYKEGDPPGDTFDVKVRKVSDDAILAEETFLMADLTTTPRMLFVEFSTLSYQTNIDVYVSIEYSNGDTDNCILLDILFGEGGYGYTDSWSQLVFVANVVMNAAIFAKTNLKDMRYE